MTTNISTLGQNLFIRSQVLALQNQMTTLQEQVSSGKKSTVFSGVNQVAALSLQLNNATKAIDEFINNIENAKTRTQPIQSVLALITELADKVRNDALIASSDALPTAKGNGSLKAEAQEAIKQISVLLNTRVGNDYLFGGRTTVRASMPDFGNVNNAGTILGQVAALNSSNPLDTTAASGDKRYDAIKTFLNNGLTKTTVSGGAAPAPYGYIGESGQPGGNEYRFTTSAAAVAGATSITVGQGFDLPVPGQYIEFGTIPPQNGAFQVTAVAGNTITFTRVPATQTGLDFAIASGTSVNVTTPAAVTNVVASNANTATDNTLTGPTAGGAGAGSSTLTVSAPGSFSVGQTVEFEGHTTQYAIASIVGANVTFTPPLTNAVAAGEGLRVAGQGAGFAKAGENTIKVQSPTSYSVGDRIQFAGSPATYYDVTAVDNATGKITVSQSGVGGGLASAVTLNEGITVTQGSYSPGSTIITLASVSGVTAGMAVKFSNSACIYTVVGVDSTNNTIQITAESTTSGFGLEDAIQPPVTIAGGEVTASFGAQVDPLSVRIDNGVDIDYGIRADNPAIRTVLNALFALATTDLSVSTETGFREIAIRAATDLARGSQGITSLAADLGVKEAMLESTETRHKDFQVVISTQIDRAENVDMAEAVSKLTQTQTNLQASFQLLATLRDLSLSNYL